MTNNQNRLLLASQQQPQSQPQHHQQQQRQNQPSSNNKSPNNNAHINDDESLADNLLSVDDDFDLYWREEARNPHRNRIRIGRQYQATVPPLLKQGEKDTRKLNELETMSFCPKKSSKVSDAELEHYFKIAKSLNIFASLVETRSLLGRDVTIADLNHIRHKEGLSLASVIQPTRQTANYGVGTNILSATNTTSLPTITTQQPSTNIPTSPTSSKSSGEPTSSCSKDQVQPDSGNQQQQTNEQLEKITLNQPLMRALSHFISLHHPCHHDAQCKKLLKEAPLEDNSLTPVLRHGSFSGKETKARISRSAAKQQLEAKSEENNRDLLDQTGDLNQTGTYDDWTREEVELFSKAIEVCGKNFGSIKKEFLPSKSVKSIVEYYYIGYRDSSDNCKKKATHSSNDTSDSCGVPDLCSSNNSGGSNGSGHIANGDGPKNVGESSNTIATSTTTECRSSTSTSRTSTFKSENNNPEKKLNSTTSTNLISPSDNQLNNSSKSSTSTSKMPMNSKQTNIDSHNLLNGFQLDPNIPKTTIYGNSLQSNSVINTIDKRMSVYNFDDDNNREELTLDIDCPRPGPEVRPLKAKPVLPTSNADQEGETDGGSLKFFMDGKMVLKLNACQDQQQGVDKCQWVQSNDKSVTNSNRQKRYLKRGNPGEKAPLNNNCSVDDKNRSTNNQNNDSISSQAQDEMNKYNKTDYYKDNRSMTLDDDSKESMNSSSTASLKQEHLQTPSKHQHQQLTSNSNNNSNNNNNRHHHNHNRSQKRQKVKNSNPQTTPNTPQTQIMPLNNNDLFNGLAGNSQGGGLVSAQNFGFQSDPSMNPNTNPMLNHTWLQSNIAMAAAILGGIPGFPSPSVMQQHHLNIPNLSPNINNNQNLNNMNQMTGPVTHGGPITSKPMDLSVEHNISPKTTPQKTGSRDRSRNRQVPRNV